MFTGIIQTTGKIKDKKKDKIVIEAPDVIKELKIGSSIAVDGACLTVVKKSDKDFTTYEFCYRYGNPELLNAMHKTVLHLMGIKHHQKEEKKDEQ